MYKKKKKIGEILLERKFVSEEALAEALKHQKEVGGPITQYLLLKGYLHEDDLARCLSDQFGFPYLSLKGCRIPDEIVSAVPAELVKKYRFVPMGRAGTILTVVMTDPLDTQAVEAIEQATGLTVQQFVGIISEINSAIEKYYPSDLEEIVKAKRARAPKRNLAGEGIQASEATSGAYDGIIQDFSLQLKEINGIQNDLDEELLDIEAWCGKLIEDAEAFEKQVKDVIGR